MAPSRKPVDVGLELYAVDNVSETTEKVEKRLSRYTEACKKVTSFGSAAIDTIGSRFTNFSVALSSSIVLFNDQVVKPLTSMISNFSQVGSSTKSVASAMQTKSMRPAEVLCLRCRKFILLALKPSH